MVQETKYVSNRDDILPVKSHLQLSVKALLTAGIKKEVDKLLLDTLMLIMAAQSCVKGINATIIPS